MADNTENKGKKVIVGLALIIAGIFLMICLTAELIGSAGFFGVVGEVIEGIFSVSGIFLFLLLTAYGVCRLAGVRFKFRVSALIAAAGLIWLLLLIVQLATSRGESGAYINVNEVYTYGQYISACYKGDIVSFGGAFIALSFYPIFSLLGTTACWLVFIAATGVCVYVLSVYALTPGNIVLPAVRKKTPASKPVKPVKEAPSRKEADKKSQEVELPPVPADMKPQVTVRRPPDSTVRRNARNELFGNEEKESAVEAAPAEEKKEPLTPREQLFGENVPPRRRYSEEYESQAREPGERRRDTAPKILHENNIARSGGFGSGFIPGQNTRAVETRTERARSNVPKNKDLLKYKEDDLYGADDSALPPIIDGDAFSRSLKGTSSERQPEKKPENKVRMGMFGYPEAVPAEGAGEEEQTVGEREEKGRYDFGGERTGVSGVKERAVETDEKAEAVSEEKGVNKPEEKTPSLVWRPIAGGNGYQMSVEDNDIESTFKKREFPRVPYKAPPLSLLAQPDKQPGEQDDLQKTASVLENALSMFKINAEVKNIIRGPSVARFEIALAPGQTIKQVVNYSKDIERELCIKSGIRILTHIPNKNLFGIEIPLNHARPVLLRSVLESAAFKKKGGLLFALGIDIEGNSIVPDLAKMPHVLLGGATGNGKSVCLNSMIASLLYKYSPEELRFIVVDPKFVEFSYMKDLPHMLMPQSLPSAEKAIKAFTWLVDEMERRYVTFSKVGVREIDEYNELIDKNIYEPLPRIVLIVDELNDLMSFSKHECEAKIARLAQKARGAGIHLVLATQRPSVDVVTGTIKNNLPGRIALKVTSVNDSKTILDTGGPDKLIGPGDMLFQKDGAPIRLQGAYVSGEELKAIANYIRENNASHFSKEAEESICMEPKEEEEEDEVRENDRENDPYFVEALKLAVTTGNASISMLQRKFRIGFGRAGSIVETMEAKGFVSKQEQNKPRTVFLTADQFNELYGDKYGRI